MQEETYTICAICEQACGIKVTTENNQVLKVEPDQDHAFSWRDFCIKGARSHLALTHPLRITTPMKRVGDRYVATSYEEAIQDISTRLKKIIKENGPEAVASYTGNPNGHNFGSALFQSLFLDAIGTRNRYWVGSIDQNALHVVSQALYGTPWVSLQTDIDYCDYFLLIGTNPAISTMCWIGYSPDGWKRLLTRQTEGAKIQSRLVQIRPQVPYPVGKLKFMQFFCIQYLRDALMYMVKTMLRSRMVVVKKVPLGEPICCHFLGEYGIETNHLLK